MKATCHKILCFLSTGGRLKLLSVLALATVPMTVYAITDYTLSIHYTGEIGYGNSFPYNSWAGIMMVGHYSGVYDTNYTRNALAVGEFCMIYDHNSAVIGQWNKNTGGDELLILGNGTYSGGPSNALEVFRNGNMNVQGAITCAAGGDIPMYGE